MIRRTFAVLAGLVLSISLLAGPAMAGPAMPDTGCLRAGVAVIGPEGLKAAGRTGAVGGVITGHLFSPGDWPWAACS